MRKLLLALFATTVLAYGIAVAADNYAATQGSGKTFRCIEITGSICIPSFVISDNTGQLLGTAVSPVAVQGIGVAQDSSISGVTLAPIALKSYASTNIYPVGDPCQTTVKVSTPIGSTANVKIINATSAKTTYICHMFLVGASAETVAVVSGTGTLCATSSNAMIGVSPVANSMSFGANSGYSIGSGGNAVANSSATNTDVCFIKSGSSVWSGVVTYVQQ